MNLALGLSVLTGLVLGALPVLVYQQIVLRRMRTQHRQELHVTQRRLAKVDRELERERERNAADSWRGCVDRMSGAFDDSELLDNRDGWGG